MNCDLILNAVVYVIIINANVGELLIFSPVFASFQQPGNLGVGRRSSVVAIVFYRTP